MSFEEAVEEQPEQEQVLKKKQKKYIKIKPKIQENQDPPQPKLQTTHCDDIKKILSIFKSEEKTAHLPNKVSTKIKNNNSKCGTASILPTKELLVLGVAQYHIKK